MYIKSLFAINCGKTRHIGGSMIIKNDVEDIARLACIELDNEDLQEFTIQLNTILEYFEELEDVEAELTHQEEGNVLRADNITPSLSQQDALSNAPRFDSGYFRGPRILGAIENVSRERLKQSNAVTLT